ncbi:MAG: hypothetical protein WCF67_12995 [Chitinophagaceae bacterium]
MKKILSFILVSIALLSLTACITALQPLVSYDKIIKDNRINGSWTHEGETIIIEPLPTSRFAKDVKEWAGKQGEKVFAFTGDPKKDSILFTNLYAVSFEEDGVSYDMVAELIRLGNGLYMDLYPAAMNDKKQKEDNTDPYNFNYDYVGGFTMAKVEITGNSNITLKFLNGDFIKEQITGGKMKLKHEKNELFDTFLITASTQELQLFVEKYGNDERIYSKETTISLTKK